MFYYSINTEEDCYEFYIDQLEEEEPVLYYIKNGQPTEYILGKVVSKDKLVKMVKKHIV